MLVDNAAHLIVVVAHSGELGNDDVDRVIVDMEVEFVCLLDLRYGFVCDRVHCS